MNYLFLSYICSTVLIFNNEDKNKNSYIVIINIVIIIKKRSGGNDAMLQGDFALEPSENFELFFSELTSLTSNFMHQFEGISMENVKIKRTHF